MLQKISDKVQSREGLTLLASITLVFAMFALLGLGVFAFAKSDSSNTDITNVPTITVTGNGESFAQPDIAQFDFTVSQDASSMTDAQNTATTNANALVAKLKSAGIAAADIQTTGFNASPKYQNEIVNGPAIICPDGSCPPVTNQVIVGYTVSITYSVKVRDLSQVGAIATLITNGNVQSVDGPNFGLANPNQVSNDAQAKAIADATAQADTLADQLGVHLGRITSFQTSSGNSGIVPMAYGAMAKSAGAPDLEPGQTDVKSSVTITYEIK
jgi:uncharacterized protein